MDPLVIQVPDDLTPAAFEQIVFTDRQITLDPGLLESLDGTRRQVLARLSHAGPVYGINTGMGYLAGVRLSESEQQSHQRNLLLGRAVGGPPYLDPTEVRAIVLARLAGFLRGYAGVTPQLCQFIAERLNDHFVPAIPREGIGCAGEIIPLSHAFQTFIGVGSVLAADGTVIDAAAALAQRQVTPYEPATKEGIALLAGAPGALGLAAVHAHAGRVLARQLLTAAACAIDAIRAPLMAYDPRVARLANDPVMDRILGQLARLLAGADGERRATQAPVSFRVIPQVLAHVERSIRRLEEDIQRTLAASDDSPAFIDDDFVTTGNFHAIGLAAGMDAVALALVQAGELAAQHIHRLLDSRFSGLPDQLTKQPGPRAGLVVVQKRVVGTIHELRRLVIPASVGVMDTSLGQEDVMTFGFEAAEKLRRIEALVQEVVACELLTAHQALALGARKVAVGLSHQLALIRNTVQPVEEDRPLGADIGMLIELLDQGAFA